MRAKFLSAAAAAALVALTGAAAFAQSSSSSSTTTTTTTSPMTGQSSTTTRSESYVGRNVVDGSGNVVGTITERRDNSYVVNGGQYLGAGTRTYVFPSDKIIVNGEVYSTPLTREQIIVLPTP